MGLPETTVQFTKGWAAATKFWARQLSDSLEKASIEEIESVVTRMFLPAPYGCQFGGCPHSYATPQQLTQHYIEDHGAQFNLVNRLENANVDDPWEIVNRLENASVEDPWEEVDLDTLD